jgi:hypothetical protein
MRLRNRVSGPAGQAVAPHKPVNFIVIHVAQQNGSGRIHLLHSVYEPGPNAVQLGKGRLCENTLWVARRASWSEFGCCFRIRLASVFAQRVATNPIAAPRATIRWSNRRGREAQVSPTAAFSQRPAPSLDCLEGCARM